jgi:hypothetical protein
MSKRIFPVLLVASSLVALIGCGKEDEREKKALNLPTGTPKRPQGAEALTVRPGAAEPFTKADVEAYFKARNIPKNAGSPDQFLVDSLEFITSKEVSQRLQGASTGLDDADRVGFATLSGTFVFTGPKGRPAIFHRAYGAFDAASGNLLMIGTLADENRPQ